MAELALDFKKLEKEASGAWGAHIYSALYYAAEKVTDGRIIEVGTGRGAATIVLARAAMATGAATVISIDNIDQDPVNHAAIEKALDEIESNFKAFDVAEHVEFLVGPCEKAALQLPRDLKTGMLVLDADGAIDRGFSLFYNSLIPGAPIVINAYDEKYAGRKAQSEHVYLDPRKRLTTSLVTYFERLGLLEKDKVLEEVYFGRKPANVTKDVEFNLSEIMKFYRDLVFMQKESP